MNKEFGQWIGVTEAETGHRSVSVLNIERRTPELAQVIAISPNGFWRVTSSATLIRNGDVTTGEISDYKIFDPQGDRFVPVEEYWEQRKEQIPKDAPAPPKFTRYESRAKEGGSYGTYEDNFGRKGKFELRRRVHDGPRKTVGPLTWEEFKKEIDRFRGVQSVYFRGQDTNKLPLQTLFHRSGRNDMVRYLEEDIPRLRHEINAASKYNYQMFGEDFLGLLSLAQHHGYPTPLLDWSRSPYVAAFFAFDCFNNCQQWEDRPDPVRVFAFESASWPKANVSSLKDPTPNLQFTVPQAHNNPRFLPQQSVALYSNVDDIEGFISFNENREKTSYLTAFDIRSDQRQIAIDDLRFMGITASSLFPGFEGICRGLRLETFR